MSYEKQHWVDHTSMVTAEKMNHIEEGIYNASKNNGASLPFNFDIVNDVYGYYNKDNVFIAFNSGTESIDPEIPTRISDLETFRTTTEEQLRIALEYLSAATNAINSHNEVLTKLEGDSNVEGSVDYKIKQAIGDILGGSF